MRPEAPANFGGGRFERIPRLRLPPSWRMIVRNLSRRPVKAGLSVLGVAMAVALMVVGRFGLGCLLVELGTGKPPFTLQQLANYVAWAKAGVALCAVGRPVLRATFQRPKRERIIAGPETPCT